MKQTFSILFFLVLSAVTYSQTTETKYYKDASMFKEASEKKAKYKLVSTKIQIGHESLEFSNVETSTILWNQEFKNDLPFGVWFKRSESGEIISKVDFSQNIYTSENDTIKSSLKKNQIEPELKEQQMFLMENIEYPMRAVEEGIQGIVYVRLKILTDGTVSEILIVKGSHPLLDYEAYRVLSLSKNKWSPAKNENGEPVECYYTMPINFRLG